MEQARRYHYSISLQYGNALQYFRVGNGHFLPV
jgi:hypothetical protein